MAGRAGVARGVEKPADGLLVISPVAGVGEGIATVNGGGCWIDAEPAFASDRVGDNVTVGRGGRIGSVATAILSRSEGICAEIVVVVGGSRSI
ncbi:MAG: hypothetical protein P8189_11900 [Anaerolineae bacterium]